MRRRLLLGVGLGIPIGLLATGTVVTGAFVGTNFFQIIAFHVPCHLGDPDLPWLGMRVCGSGVAGVVPYLAGLVGLGLMVPYAGLLRRWMRGLPPLVGWSGMWLVGRVLAGCFVGLSALAGGSWIYIQLNDRYLHDGCLAPEPGRTQWLCEGNIYYGIHPVVLFFTVALLVMYPVLWNAAESGVDLERPRVRNGGEEAGRS